MSHVKRRYDASGRQQQARARRLSVVEAARELFQRDGFRVTTISSIAAHAGVSAETVYKQFGSKAAVAKAVFDHVIAGDDEPVPVAERPAMRAVWEEPDARLKIARFVDGLAQRQARSAKVQAVIRDGRHVDDSLVAVWRKMTEEGLTGMSNLARHLVETGQLRPDLDPAEVRDVLWNYLAIDHYERLVLDQGWTQTRYASWLTETISAALLPVEIDLN
jgi:AcrR family transcriptional regulator